MGETFVRGDSTCDGAGMGCLAKAGGNCPAVLSSVGEIGDNSMGLGSGGKVGDGDLRVLSGKLSLGTGEVVFEADGGGGGGGGGDVVLLSTRKDERCFLSGFEGNDGSVTTGIEGFPLENECRFFRGNGNRSSEFATRDDIV